MEHPTKTNSDLEFIKKFCKNPRDFHMETLQETHRYISLALRNEIPAPKKSILIDIFREFAANPIKDYVFHRINKKILLELALRIIQEIAEKGAEHAWTLQLVVGKTSNGIKSVVIAKNAPSADKQTTFEATEIEDVTFKISDRAGMSPFPLGKTEARLTKNLTRVGILQPEGVRENPWTEYSRSLNAHMIARIIFLL